MNVKVEQLSRRQFLIRLGAASATVTFAGVGISTALNSTQVASTRRSVHIEGTESRVPGTLPNAGDPVQPVPGTRAEYTPVEEHYAVDYGTTPPTVDGETWRLSINGLVGSPLQLSLMDIRNHYSPIHQYITMSCISNRTGGDLIGTTLWTGVSLREVLESARLSPRASHLKITAADGYDEVLSLDVVQADPTVMLTYDWDGQPLPVKNGFPLRIHIPDRFGMKQPKWITGIEAIDTNPDGYWVRRGWSKEGIIHATSVIDTIAVDEMYTTYTSDGIEQPVIPIGGFAWAGSRGVSRVEVQIDGGEWREATLRAPLNNNLASYKTWRIWRYEWPFEAGEHLFSVRMFEADGTPQIEQVSDIRPHGATGLHSANASL